MSAVLFWLAFARFLWTLGWLAVLGYLKVPRDKSCGLFNVDLNDFSMEFMFLMFSIAFLMRGY
jgi:hypothetical protein